MLCNVCQRIFRGEWPLKWDDLTWSEGLPHHETVDSLLNSVQNRCYICARIWRNVRDTGDETSLLPCLRTWHARNKGLVTEYTFHIYGGRPDMVVVNFCCQDDKVEDSLNCWFKLPKFKLPKFKLPKVDCMCDIDVSYKYCPDHYITLAAKYATCEYEVASSTSAPSCLDLAYQWLKECTSSHVICAQKSEDSAPFTPTRLLDTRPQGAAESNLSCKLVVTSETGVQAPYATLSHCWGAEPIETLTSSTLEAMKLGIVISELSQTFRDAIVIARHLRIRYLWIDSLCIIQDSPEDWSREASAMKEVYANSTCTIAATWGDNSSTGCFVERDPLLISPSKITTAWTGRAEDRVTKMLAASTGRGVSNDSLLVLERDAWHRQIEHGALNRRGWVVQERLLSPRVLHFGKEQIFWECRNSIASEALPVPHNYDCDLGEDFPFKRQILSDSEQPLHHKLGRWQDIISCYMRCVLTRPEDKLIAISGVAKAFQSVAEDEYLAGLWREDLLDQLLWFVKSCMQENGLLSVKPHPYRAPSWSWASVDANITWPYISPYSKALVNIQETAVQPVTNDPMGQIRGGHIKLRGRVVKAEFREGEQGINWEIRIGDTGSDVNISLDLPGADTNNHWRQGYFLPVMWTPSWRPVKGLLVHPVDAAEAVFERCGYFTWENEETARKMFGLRTATKKKAGKIQEVLAEFVDQNPLQLITLI
jgi:hypothetical protein